MSQFRNDENIDANQSSSREFKEENEISLTDDTLGLIGTSLKGPAFVPHTFQEFGKSDDVLNTYENVFGSPLDMDHPDLSPLSAQEWFNQGGEQLAFTRVLGIGKTGIPNNEGIVEGSGFIVGGNVVSGSINEGYSEYNKFATAGGSNGKTNFIGGHYKNKQYTGIENGVTKIAPFNDYLEQIGESQSSVSLITDVLFCPQGTKILLQKDNTQNGLQSLVRLRENIVLQSFSDATLSFNTNIQYPYLFIKGLGNKDFNVLKDYKRIRYVKKREFRESYINNDLSYFLDKGNLRYANFSLNFLDNLSFESNKNFIFNGSSNSISYEDFQSSYKSASTSWIVSQPTNRENISDNRVNMHNNCVKLFKFHAIDDGEISNRYRIRITPKKLGNVKTEDWSIFDVAVWEYNKKENTFIDLFKFTDLNLDPDSESYIGLVFGTQKTYFDFNENEVITSGRYKQTNNHLIVEINEKIEFKDVKSYELMPSGFMPYPRINTSGITNPENYNVLQKPVDYVWNILIGKEDKLIKEKYWGVLFDNISTEQIDKTILNNVYKFKLIKKEKSNNFRNYYWYTKYFQDNYLVKSKNVWVRDLEDNDSDLTNSFFHLEKIMYIPAEEDDPVQKNWEIAMYRRDGKKISDITSLSSLKIQYKYVNIDELLKSDDENNSIHSEYLSFDFFTCGGFDGVNILDNDKRLMSQTALVKELEDENQNGQIEGPTYFTYKKAHDIMVDDANSEFDILSIPTIGHHYLNKKISTEANKKGRYLTVLNSPEYSNHVDNTGINNIPTSAGIIKDYNHFYIEPGESDVNERFKTKPNIGKYIDSGTMTSLDSIKNNYYDNRYTLNVLNTSEGFLDNELYEDKRFVVMPAFIAIKSFASGIASGPVDNVNSFNDSLIEVKRVINNSLNSPDTDEYSKLIKFSLKSETNANFVVSKSIFNDSNIIKLNSGNTSLITRNSLSRFAHNTRIILNIKKNIKYMIFQNDLLFNNNAKVNNINTLLNFRLNTLLQSYVDLGIIRDFFVKLNTGTSNKEKEDYLDYILRSRIGISLFGKLDNNIIALSLDEIINSTQNNLTEISSIDIMIPSI
jgi:hypothetical protein